MMSLNQVQENQLLEAKKMGCKTLTGCHWFSPSLWEHPVFENDGKPADSPKDDPLFRNNDTVICYNNTKMKQQ